MQWLHVKAGAVKIVHNSFSVHPEGTGARRRERRERRLRQPNPAEPPRRAVIARFMKVLPTTTIDPSQYVEPGTAVVGASDSGNPGPQPTNHRLLRNIQFPKQLSAPISLQWYGVRTTKGIVIVHNTIQIKLANPATTAPITLSNIAMPGRIPPIQVTTSQAQTATADATAVNHHGRRLGDQQRHPQQKPVQRRRLRRHRHAVARRQGARDGVGRAQHDVGRCLRQLHGSDQRGERRL